MSKNFFLYLSIVFAFPGHALANDLIRQSLAWQVEQADIVVIGRAGERRFCGTERNLPCVEIKPEVYFKGVESDDDEPIYLLLDIGIAEARITDIDLSGRLMLMVKKGSSGLYQSVNGRFSVQRIEDVNLLAE